jgi:glucan-binding YG repeat protein
MSRKVLAVLIFGFLFQLSQINANASGAENLGSKPKLQFPVMSDVHINQNVPSNQSKFITALKKYKELAPNYQALAIVGDFTDQGLTEQYDTFNQILEEHVNPGAETIIAVGNHEFYEGVYWPNPAFTDQMFIERFVTKTNMPGLYYDKWVKGTDSTKYHFIVLGSEESKVTNSNNHDYAVLSDEQYQWLKETLRIGAHPRKPIFVFLHQPIDDTVYGSEQWGGNLRDNKLKKILQQYPQVILFSGHSHYLLQHPRSVYQDGFTMVNTGALAYTLYDGSLEPLYFSQGLLVNVYNNKVEINARDFSSNTWVNRYTVKLPYEKTIDDRKSPIFPKYPAPAVKSVTSETAEVSWPAAIDNTQVDKYIVKLNGKAIQTIYTKFWKDSPKQYSTTIHNLKGNTEYTVDIVAVDAWKNESLDSVKIILKTDKYKGWVQEGKDYYYYDYETGERVTGWLKYKEKWYYFDSNGIMQRGWIKDQNKWYFLYDTGAMATGWVKVNGQYYYLSGSGAMHTGWLFQQNKWYYLTSSGAMAVGWAKDGDNWYYFADNGVMKVGWVKDKDQWYYLKSSGAMAVGWIKVDNNRYFLANNGAMKVGWVKDKGQWYYLKSSGAMHTGWLNQSGNWYYLNASGVMQTGWVKLEENWYYFYDDGRMAANTKIGSYRIGKDGAMIP